MFDGTCIFIQIYPNDHQLNNANEIDTEAPRLDLHLFLSNGHVFFFKIYDKLNDFDIENFQLLTTTFPVLHLVVFVSPYFSARLVCHTDKSHY